MSGDIMQQTLLEFIDYLRYKVENKKFTLTELETVHLFLLNTFDVRATIDELADYYNKDKARIRTEIARKVSSKPIRRVYYRFSDINDVVPKSWKHQSVA